LHYTTVSLFSANIRAETSLEALLHVLSGAAEFDELPVRHNEEKLNEGLAKEVRWPVDMRALDDPHVKTNLLLQAHFSRIDLPVSDYITDTKSVLDQSIRVLQAMVDVAANGGWLETVLSTMHLLQMIMQGRWWEKDERLALNMLPHVNADVLSILKERGLVTGHDLLSSSADHLRGALRTVIGPPQVAEVLQVWMRLPRVEVRWRLEPSREDTNREWVLRVELFRRVLKRMPNSRAYVPYFPKVKDEGWWLVAGNPKTREVFALKRVTFLEHLNAKLVLPKHLKPESEPIRLYLVSDCYVGLDQEHEIRGAA